MSNIVRFGRKQESNQPKNDGSKVATTDAGLTFEEIVRRNLENAERVKRERETANKNVLKSYRIK